MTAVGTDETLLLHCTVSDMMCPQPHYSILRCVPIGFRIRSMDLECSSAPMAVHTAGTSSTTSTTGTERCSTSTVTHTQAISLMERGVERASTDGRTGINTTGCGKVTTCVT